MTLNIWGAAITTNHPMVKYKTTDSQLYLALKTAFIVRPTAASAQMSPSSVHPHGPRSTPTVKGSLESKIQLAVSGFVLNHGMVGSDCRSPDIKSHALVGSGVDRSGRYCLYGRRRFLCCASRSLCPLCLAPLRDCRNHLPFLRRALVFSITLT